MKPSSESRESVRKRLGSSGPSSNVSEGVDSEEVTAEVSWRRILLLIIAITVHNIPGMLTIVHTWYLYVYIHIL